MDQYASHHPKFSHHPQLDHRPKQKALTLALSAALAVMAHAAMAQQVISSPTTGTFNNWTTGDITVTSSGTISGGQFGIEVAGSVGTLTNGGSISGRSTAININAGSDTIGALINNGAIVGRTDAILNFGTIGVLTNNGTITANNSGLGGNGNIGTLTNNGIINITYYAIDNGGTIDTLINSSTGAISGGFAAITNAGRIGVLTNDGTISGGSGINNLTAHTIGALTNSGSISGSPFAINNTGNINTLTNTSTGNINGISPIRNASTIGVLTNDGIISGNTGIYNSSTIGTLSNSGTITGSVYAIYSGVSASPGLITNSGVIAGTISNASSNDLSISGGTGTIFGSLTGYGGGNTIGTIIAPASNLAFGSGNLLLNDNINVGSNAVNNTGTAVLQVNQPVSIVGNYNQGASATLQIGVASGATTLGALADTGYGRLMVSGNATIASGSSVTLQSNGYAFAAGQRYVVVDTAGTAVYNPGTLKYSINGYISTVTGSAVANGSNSDLVLNVLDATPGSASPPPTSPPTSPPSSPPTSAPTPAPSPASIATASNATAALTGLLNYTGISNPELLNLYDAVLGSLSQGSAATANHIGKQLGAIQTGGAAAAPTFGALSVVGAHVDALRLAQAAGGTGVATGEGPRQWGVWGQAYGGHASQNERDQVDGYSANYGGLLVGVDKAINDNWRAGGVFTYSNTAINNTGDTAGDTTRVNGYGLIGYASYAGSPWYVNFSGAVIQQQYDTSRVVSMQGFSSVANGQFSGQQYVAQAEAGYPLALGSATLTPLASLTYSYLNQGAYTESGGAALSVNTSHVGSVKSGLGAKLEKGFSTRYGEIVPQIQAQWIHEYNHTRQLTGGSYGGTAPGETAFTTVGAAPVSDLADISLGATLLRANNLSLSVRYELQAASGFVSQTGSVRLRQLF